MEHKPSNSTAQLYYLISRHWLKLIGTMNHFAKNVCIPWEITIMSLLKKKT